ncbi:unnamed protein product, partial [Closterium sp. NIES-53]
GADLQDQGVDQFTPASQRVTHCTCARTGRHLATFTRRPGSSLYTLSTESPPVTASGQAAASSQVFAAASRSGPESAPCLCRLLSHQTLLWHHRLGHPSLPRLRGMASRVLVSGLPRSLPPPPPGPAPTCVPCVEGRQRAAPHSSEFPPTEAPLQTLHMDVWGPTRVRGQGHERYFLLVVDDYSRYTTVFPLRSKGDITEVLIDWIRAARLQLRESFGSDFPVLRLHSDRGGEFSSARLGAFCHAQGIRQTFTLPASPQQNGIAERRIGMVPFERRRQSHVLQRFDFTYSSPQATPLSTRHSLSALPSDESVEPSGPYPELVGCLMYLMTCTRPDLAYPLSIFACYVAPGRHRPEHMAAVKRVLRYLCSTSGMGLVLGGRRPVVLTGHADASWADDQATQRSSQGYTFSLGSGSVSWRSTRSSSILSSSCEAEIYAGAMAAQELLWLTYLLTDLGEQPRSPPVLYVDNKAMLALCREHRLEHRMKHIALRYFLARELQQRGQLRLAYVASEANTADIFTKALAPGDHQRFCTLLGLLALLCLTGLVPVRISCFSSLLWGAEPGGAESEGAEPGGAEPGSAEPGGEEPGGAGSARVASRSASSRRELLSPQELREWFARRWSRAAGAGGTPRAAGTGGAAAAAGVGPAGASGAAGAGAAAGVGAGVCPAGGTAGAAGGTGAAGPAGVGAVGASGATGAGAAGGVSGGGSPDAGPSAGAGVGAVGAGGAAGTSAAAGGTGAVPAGSGDPARLRPYFVPLLEQVLGLPPSSGPAPSLGCPQPVQSQSLLQPVSPLPAPSPYTGPTGGLAERREPASRPASPIRAARTSGRTPRQRPPVVPRTHQMALRPSTASQRVPLPSPPTSSLPVLADPESDSLRAASPTVARLLSTVVTDPSFESAAASALIAKLVDFAACCRLDYAAGLVAESASVCPPSVGGECALSTDVLEDR